MTCLPIGNRYFISHYETCHHIEQDNITSYRNLFHLNTPKNASNAFARLNIIFIILSGMIVIVVLQRCLVFFIFPENNSYLPDDLIQSVHVYTAFPEVNLIYWYFWKNVISIISDIHWFLIKIRKKKLSRNGDIILSIYSAISFRFQN